MVRGLKLSLSSQCIKYILFVFNLVFVITGIILLSIGSVIHGVYQEYEHFLDSRYFSVPSLFIAVGCIIFFVAFFGCCGAIKENYCMILTFATLMSIIFILEFSAGISGYVLRSDAREVVEKNMKDSMQYYKNDTESNKEYLKLWDVMQSGLKCCGTNGAADWSAALNGTDELPFSCCTVPGGTIGGYNCTMSSEDKFKVGCLDAVSTFIQDHAVQLGAAALVIAFLQALGIWFSIYLARSIRKNYNNM